MEKNNTIFWIVGIALLLLVVSQSNLPGFPFAIVTKTVCVDGTVSYYEMEGNVWDKLGINNGVNHGGIFVPGKLGQALEFKSFLLPLDSVSGWSGQISLNTLIKQEGIGAINLYQSVNTFGSDLNMEKVINSTDFTGKTLYYYIYLANQDVIDAWVGGVFYLKNDDGNFNRYSLPSRSNLAIGWNLISINADNPASAVGSPNLKEIMKIKFSVEGQHVEARQVLEGEIIIDNLHSKIPYVDFPIISSENQTIVMWIKNSSIDSEWYFASETNLIAGANKIIPIGPNFGLGDNVIVDEIAIFSPALTINELSNLSIGKKVCYTTTYEENITCKEYATSQLSDTGTGCINYSGEFFPNCEYSWNETNTYKLVNNICIRQLYCADGDLTLEECEDKIIALDDTTSSITSSDTSSIDDGSDITSESLREKLDQKVWTIAGFDITAFHLIILSFILFTGLYYFEKSRK